jgi:hypothetical protein
MKENYAGRDERLLVQGTQTRAPPTDDIPQYSTFHYSNIPVKLMLLECGSQSI